MAKITSATKHPVNSLFEVLIGDHTYSVSVENDVLNSLGVAEIKTLVKTMAHTQHDTQKGESLDELVEE